MGYMSTRGSATEAPEYHSNSIGTPPWSGLHESEFTDVLTNQLRNFIKFEAERQGFNDSAQDRIGENAEFFHASFLGGWPQQLWNELYQIGIKNQQKPQDEMPTYDEAWP